MERSDTPFVIRLRQSAIDDDAFPLGIVRLSTDEHVGFMNRALREMVGDEIQVGSSVSSMAFDTRSRADLRAALQERFHSQQGSSYRLRLQRKDTGTRVRVRVAAVPEYDADGQLIGSVGFLVDESIDAATMGIHKAIQQASDSAALYAALCKQLHEVVGFETMQVTSISKGGNHLQLLFEDPPGPRQVMPTKWWPMQPFVKAMFDKFEPGQLDLIELFKRPEFAEYARTDPSVQQFVDRGFKNALRLGVYRAGQLRATVTLLRTQPAPYTVSDFERCTRLPIVEAVNTAMTLDQHRHQEFRLKLVDDIVEVAGRIPDVARCLVDSLREHYDWEHVSLFWVDEDQRQLRMICQAGGDAHRLDENYSQGWFQGLLGNAYQNAKAVIVGDVQNEKDPNARPYFPGIKSTCSEMVLPVPGSKLRWLLNVESSLRDAFADEEHASVALLLRVAGFILDSIATQELNSTILKSVADAVILTNSLGIIQNANEAAARLLGRPLAELQQRKLSDYITSGADEPLAEAEDAEADGSWQMTQTAVAERNTGVLLVSGAGKWPPTPVEFRRPDDTLVPVLMSSARLPAELGGKVFVASDLTNQKRVEEMELLKQGLRHIASEIRVPLALAATFLGDASREAADMQELKELIDKSLKQIRKADLPLERVVRLASAAEDKPLPKIVFDLRAAVDQMLKDLPLGEPVRVASREDVVLVEAAPHELAFCMQSLLAYLLRRKSQVEHVAIKVGQRASKAFVTLSLVGEGGEAMRPPAGAADDLPEKLSLAEPVIEGLMRRMGGSYDAQWRETPRFRLVLASGAGRSLQRAVAVGPGVLAGSAVGRA